MISLALPKGRIAEELVELLLKAGYKTSDLNLKGRKLVQYIGDDIKDILLRNSDVATFVELGTCDVGVFGLDLIEEQKPDVYQMLDLGIGRCKMVLAGLPEKRLQPFNPVRVASKFVKIAEDYLSQKKLEHEVIKLYGNIELAPLLDLSDFIVDIVSTGSTLKENGLVIIEKIFDVSAYLIVNKISHKIKHEEVMGFIKSIREVLEEEKAE